MSNSYQELMKVSRDFRDLARDLILANTNTFDTAINFFRTFCEETPAIQEILEPIIQNDKSFDTQAWFNKAVEQTSSFIGSGDATLPSKKLDALTVVYNLLWSPDTKNLLITLGQHTMFTKRYDDQLRLVNESMTNLLVRYIIRELEDKIDMVKPQNVPNSQTMTFNGPTNFANNSNSFTQNIQVNNPELVEVIAQLRSIIANTELPEVDMKDALETVDMIESEANKPQPSPTKIQKLLSFLPAVEGIAKMVESITNLISG